MTELNKPAADGTPPGYLKNASGHLVPLEQVREQDLMRDEVARRLAERALKISQELASFKREALADIADLVRIAGERYDVRLGGKKGNVQITTYDGEFKVVRSVAERIAFSEEIEAAKEIINACIIRWSEGANDNIRALVDRAFRTDSKGQLKTAAVLELLRLEIDDAQWRLGMDALRDSIHSTGTATYVRVYRRQGAADNYVPVPLDFAAV
ncbi:DUF3164 family protein [Vandammella animalimorsus]|uniref:DUF3164 family protein n=1 Tax=Vandammella animalimorsus TaxID=2029117 RepID=UPI0026FB0EEB|nr:DUF3164 family protein [Comamonadaceae bacterium]